MKKALALLMFLMMASTGILCTTGCGTRECSGSSLNGTVDLEGHRGARGKRPENTIPAFVYCMEQGMTTLELDTHVTKDKDLIIYHDDTMNGTICQDAHGNPAGKIPVKTLTVSELKTYDCGARKNEEFPEQETAKGTRLSTLKELFDFVKAYEDEHGITTPFMFNIEIKLEENASIQEILEAARITVKAIEDSGMTNRVIVQSFVMEAIKEVKRINPAMKTSALFQPTYPQGFMLTIGRSANSDEIIAQTLEAGADVISPYYLYCSSEFMRKCHEKKLLVIPWTVNEPEAMKRLLECGVDGIISDYPDRLRAAHDVWRKTGQK
ncbi:MAG: glycerophosphodiester phosphodiesterase [Spirochaetes bacterium]|nr:glycerophosphodiester phosphodiesterase [Spirochaetota bacterium]